MSPSDQGTVCAGADRQDASSLPPVRTLNAIAAQGVLAERRASQIGRFVILCAARSGSTYLCECLNSHPDIACHQELYNPFAINGTCGLYGIDTGIRDADPLAFLEYVDAHTAAQGSFKRIGFKHLFDYQPLVSEAVLNDPAQQIILLRRRNKLAQSASFQLARKTAKWRRKLGEPAELEAPQRVPFRLLRFWSYLIREHGRERLVLDRRADCLEVCYEDIVQRDGLDRVLRFLGVSTDVTIAPRILRQHSGTATWERFTNPLWARIGSKLAWLLAQAVIMTGLAPFIRRLSRHKNLHR